MKRKVIIPVVFISAMVMTGCGKNDPKPTPSQASVSTEMSTTSVEEVSFVSLDKLISAYKEQQPNTDITSIELDKTLGKDFFKVKGRDVETEYEVSIDAVTGIVEKQEKETVDSDEQTEADVEQNKLDLEGLLSIDDVINKAKKETKMTDIDEMELSKEMGTTYWKVSLKDGIKETEISLDAKSGDVLQIEAD